MNESNIINLRSYMGKDVIMEHTEYGMVHCTILDVSRIGTLFIRANKEMQKKDGLHKIPKNGVGHILTGGLGDSEYVVSIEEVQVKRTLPIVLSSNKYQKGYYIDTLWGGLYYCSIDAPTGEITLYNTLTGENKTHHEPEEKSYLMPVEELRKLVTSAVAYRIDEAIHFHQKTLRAELESMMKAQSLKQYLTKPLE